MARIPIRIRQELERGGTLVTPSPQRAQALRIAFDTTQLSSGRKAWDTPDVIGYRAWLEREAGRAADAGVLRRVPLRAAEEWALWRAATASAADAVGVAATEQLSQSLQRAARIVADWRIPLSALNSSGTAEGACLARALDAMSVQTRDSGALASHELAGVLRSWTPRSPLAFAGFAELSSARGGLIELWSEPTRGLHDHRPQPPLGAARAVAARDATEELELAAAWCRAHLEAASSARLLLIVPDLAQRRAEVTRQLDEALRSQGLVSETPETTWWLAERSAPLGDQPLVRHALLSLRVLVGRVGFEDCGAWLRGSFWRTPEAAWRARLEVWLRGVLGAETGLSELTAALAEVPAALAAVAAALRRSLCSARDALEPVHGDAPHAVWARRFHAALEALGWPGARAQHDAEREAHERFAATLAELGAAGRHLGDASALDAVRALEGLAGRTAVSSADVDAPILLSQALVDPVVHYDGIWVTGLHAERWPPRTAIDPFVPREAQARAGVPWLTPQQGIERAGALLHAWRCCATELVVSWPQRADDRNLQASALLTGRAGFVPYRAPAGLATRAQRMRATRRIEQLQDARGLAWPVGKSLPLGSRSIDYQSRCPFRAYAELRLACVPLESPRPGIDPRDRGRLLHRALELLWEQLGDSRTLREQSCSAALGALIGRCIAQAAEETLAQPAPDAPLEARRRECRRAERLMHELVALELERPAFRVAALEQHTSLELAGARLELRIDRIDAVEPNGQVLFDYKTGRQSAPGWLSERLADPQLPLYLLAAGPDVVALAMVQLAGDRVQYLGLADVPNRLPKLPELADWQAQVQRWRSQLAALTAQFLAGEAAVDPAENACRLCHLQSLCRIAHPDRSSEQLEE